MKLQHLLISFISVVGILAGCDDSRYDKYFVPTPETTEELCSDGLDNNVNGRIDCAEESCQRFDYCKNKVEICDNQIDDDGDGKADCNDSDCASAANCQTGEVKTEICDNQIDDDGDGKADCDDSDCASASNCQTGVKIEICDSQIDDDGDGKVDCEDEDCASAAHCQTVVKTEICDNQMDDDGDGKADCEDEDCASAAHCQTVVKTEICDNQMDDDADGKMDCEDEDCASAAHCQTVVKTEICDNQIDDDNDGKADCEDSDCASAANCAPKTLKNLQYKVGLVSDIHIDTKHRHDTQDSDDLVNAIDYFKKNNVDFIASCGDVAEYEPDDYGAFFRLYQDNAYEPTAAKLRLFTAIGNHDFLQLYTIQDGREHLDSWFGDTKYNFDFFTGEDNVANFIPPNDPNGKKDMYFFEYDGVWNQQYTEGRDVFSKASYYIPKDNNIFVFLSLDYGLNPHKADARASNLLDMDNKYVKQMKAYVSDTSYNDAKEQKYNYQFYHPNSLIWLKDIIENNPDKHIFVFTHHFITHKAGNGVPYNGKVFYSSRRVWPYSTDPAVQAKNYSGANSLCGLEFHFINKLNNEHKNVIWFSGHTHFQWEDEKYDECLVFCNKDFDFVQPTGNETTPLTNDIKSEADLKLYTRVNDNPKGESAWNVHIPSLAKPTDMGTDAALYRASQGGLMEVYENGVRIYGVSFKKEDANNYENKVVVTKEIFFP